MPKALKTFTLILGLIISSEILFASELFAERGQTKDIHLATIATDYVKKSYDLMVTINDRGLITAIKTRNNKKNKIKVYKISVLNQPITLVKAVGVSLVSLTCTNFATNKGCDIKIEYPSNLTLGRFKNFHAKLEKKDGRWSLTRDGKSFNRMYLIARKLMGLLIGVKRIDTRTE